MYFHFYPEIYSKLLKKGVKGLYKGDGFQLGGTVICDYEGNIIYQHIQKDFYDFPSSEDIFESVSKFYISYKDK